MKILLAQINTTVTDFSGNIAKISAACDNARDLGAEIVVTPELAMLGYPPLDLVEHPAVLAECASRLDDLAKASKNLLLIAGTALPSRQGQREGRERPAINAAVVFHDGMLIDTIAKRLLPSYDVFDEDRYFQVGQRAGVIDYKGRKIGISVCEDIWNEDDEGPTRYDIDPVGELIDAGADCIVNLSASPFDLGKAQRRLELTRRIVRENGLPLVYCNLVGGNDALIFDGRSFVLDASGSVVAHGKAFAEDEIVVDLPERAATALPAHTPDTASTASTFAMDPAHEARAALVLGLRDYMHKCGFKDAVLGLSGGIDSAVTAALAVEALGAEHVVGVAMPGPYSSEGSVTDALKLAENFGIRCPVIPIGPAFLAFSEMLTAELAQPGRDTGAVTEQNIQARARGVTLMAMSNHSGAMLLTTGNKSEMAVGYCTLYGDMSGGLAVIGDLPKMLVYDVARTYNDGREMIPFATIDKPPSAELAPDQKDSDSLPPYPALDAILDAHIVRRRTAAQIVDELGYDAGVVGRVLRLVERNEYKRRQAAPVLRVTRKAFGGGRRIPIARRLQP